MRHHAGDRGPAPPLFNPARDRLQVGAGLAAQICGLPGERLVQLSLRRSLEDPGDLGQQVGAAGCELTELGHRGGFLVLGELSPFRVMPRLAGELSHDHPVGVRSGTILIHLDMIERGYDKSKVICPLLSGLRPVTAGNVGTCAPSLVDST